jgi:hypothetical protein
MLRAIAVALLLGGPAAAAREELPSRIVRQLPRGYAVLRSASASFGTPAHHFYFVALARRDEAARARRPAPARPLLIYERWPDGGYALVGRNDHAVLRADEGGQCDPLEDGAIVASGRYVTVANVVACGQHWSSSVTFRFDSRLGYVFDNLRTESWSSNPNDDPNAEALVSDGEVVVRATKGRTVRFAAWSPATP